MFFIHIQTHAHTHSNTIMIFNEHTHTHTHIVNHYDIHYIYTHSHTHTLLVKPLLYSLYTGVGQKYFTSSNILTQLQIFSGEGAAIKVYQICGHDRFV